jgi:shikimate dehydrogenase
VTRARPGQPHALPGRLVLLGHPVAHSRSPAFQNAALRALGIPLSYEAWDVVPADLPDVLALLRSVRGAGNVTIPHKEAVHRSCDRVSDIAQRAGAVNTFWVEEDGALVGDNTDVAGLEATARALAVPEVGATVACLGAGGSAAAVCAMVERWPGARVALWARSPERAALLAHRFPGAVQLAPSAEAALSGAGLVVNATPIGMRDEALPVPVAALARDACVMDLVYRPGETRWVREARAAGHRACDGRVMLLQQGAAAFERWLHRSPPIEVMRDALAQALEP